MRWIAKKPLKEVLQSLIESHATESGEDKVKALTTSLDWAEPRLWWYGVKKSYCDDYKDGTIVGYDEPIHPLGLQGLKETDHGYVFFKKADTEYLGRAPTKYWAVKALAEARHA